ncbi:MAG: glutamate racemase [Myxococcota bacterium]|jgi:glutamate racemase
MIGVYDSGYGGLGVLRHIRALLPHHDVVYLGDSGRAPYGGRDGHTLLDFAEQAIELLFGEGCSVVVVACNTVSCVALRHLQQRYAPPGGLRRVLGVTVPAAELVAAHATAHVGILATHRTVSSGTYVTEIHKLRPLRVTQKAAPLLASIVEEGWEGTDIAELTVRRYLAELADVDTLLLGCTHYSHLLPVIEGAVRAGTSVLDPAPFVAARLEDWLARHPSFEVGTQRVFRVLCTGDPERFRADGERFLGEPIPKVHHIAERDGRLIRQDPANAPRGQIVRPHGRTGRD